MPVPDSAIVKWPDVPACYGWLSLDRRGNWRLKGEQVRHGGLIAFINRHYGADQHGNWIFQNGPQAVFVSLDYTPLVLRMDSSERLLAHTGAPPGDIAAAYLDEEGSVLLHTAAGIGLLDDRDLASFIGACRDDSGNAAQDEALQDVMAGGSGVSWRGLQLRAIRRAEVALRFGFRPDPAAG